jgi:hypothetical protein
VSPVEVLQTGTRCWRGAAPASEDAITHLVHWCEELQLPVVLPPDYLDLLRYSNGGDGNFTDDYRYIRIWSASRVRSQNEGYEITTHLPGYLGFGDDGGPGFFAFAAWSPAPWEIYWIPWSCDEYAAGFVASNLEELFGRLDVNDTGMP